MKRAISILLTLVILLSLAACTQNETPPETTPTAAEPPEVEMEHFDLNETDLDSIGELLAEREQDSYCKIQLDGLCTPVVLELEGTNIISISAYGNTVFPDQYSEYTSIYGNLWPVIYDHEDMILLNIWHDDIGYSCVLCPDGNDIETYPDEESSVMLYVDEEGQLTQSRFALKFLGIEQWDTGPIDMAVSRDDFYYSIDDAALTEEGYSTVSREYYTISDCFELDEIFNTAKENGLYTEFETLDELLDYNTQRFLDAEHTDDPSYGPDSVLDRVGYFDQYYADYEYDSQKNLIKETFYDILGDIYFTKTHSYNNRNLEVAGIWSFRGEEAYRYTNTYDEQERLTETVWYQDDKEVERFTYTYDIKGGHTETFSQNTEKKYTYTFNNSGELSAHSVYEDGKEVKTKDVTSLVKTQLLTDIWFPFIDNDTLHSQYRYNGTVPTQAPVNARKTTAADGSYILLLEGVDEEDGSFYQHEYCYDANDRLLRAAHRWDGIEHLRDEYEYDQNGRCILQVTYIGGEKDMTTERQYNSTGQLIREDTNYTTPQTYYTYDDEGMEKEVSYTVRTETYRYDDRGLLAETVVYEDTEERDRTTYDYDVNGNVMPRLDTYQYVYNAEGNPEGIWLIYEDHAAGMVLLRSHTVYVTADNARQLRDIMRTELSWF